MLLLVGPIPEGLAAAAAVVYAQMPRPRTILASGVSSVAGLPEPDVAVPSGQTALGAGVAALRRQIAAGAGDPEAPAFEPAATQARREYVCPMHPEIVRDEPGACPICGMALVAREVAGAMDGHDQAGTAMATDHGSPAPATPSRGIFACPMHPEVTQAEPGSCPLCGMRLEPVGPGLAAPIPAAHDGAPSVGTTYTCPMHPEIVRDEPGTCPICRMNLVPRARAGGDTNPSHPEHASDGDQHGQGTEAVEGGHEPAATGRNEAVAEAAPPMDHATSGTMAMPMDHDPQATDPGGHDTGHDDQAMDPSHHAMDHGGGGGFMSMVAMTRDLPRSRDGLPMERIEVPFGPLFPGLPGGLALTFTLDGDGVAAATVQPGLTGRGLDAGWTGPATTFPDRLARLDPFSPVAYRLLARRALEAAAGTDVSDPVLRGRIWWAERERVRSHLGWLAAFAGLIGDRWIAGRAASLQLALARADDEAGFTRLVPAVRALAGAVRDARLFRSRLKGVGALGPSDAEGGGPVARAGGWATDARIDDPAYHDLGFSPVVMDGNDALSRLWVRLAEVSASLDLMAAVRRPRLPDDPSLPTDFTGSSRTTIETPRGVARLHLVVERGIVTAADLNTPTDRLVALVPAVTAEAEVADALVAVASLDLSPWERDR